MAKRAAKKATNERKRVAKSGEAGFLSQISLRTVRLLESSSKLHICDNKLPTEAKVHITVGHGMNEGDGSVMIAVSVNVTLESRSPDAEKDSSLLTISGHVQCLYESQRKPSESELAGVSGMGILTAWPHIREFFASVIMRMGQPPVVLPILFVNPATKKITFLMGGNSHSVSPAGP